MTSDPITNPRVFFVTSSAFDAFADTFTTIGPKPMIFPSSAVLSDRIALWFSVVPQLLHPVQILVILMLPSIPPFAETVI